MINWFYRWLATKITQAHAVETQDEPLPVAYINTGKTKNRPRATSDRDILNSEPITFKMYKASGGWAIEFRHYDSKNDRIDHALYVVNDEEELGNHISQIITMEALKR